MPYIGHLPVRLLNDRQIRPIEYRKWADAAQRFDRRPKDQATVREYARKIRDGLEYPPLTLGISERYPEDVYVGDGHHRAIALQQTAPHGQFPFRWYWIRTFGVHMETDPFPYHIFGL